MRRRSGTKRDNRCPVWLPPPSRWGSTWAGSSPRGSPVPLPAFRYRHLGDLATIGRRAAVVKFGRLHLTGFVGWLFWSVAHIYFLIGVKNRFIVAFTWLWDYITFQRGARLITEAPGGGEAKAQS